MKKERISQILYACATIGFLSYLATKKSAYMFCGGLFSIAASIIVIINSKAKDNSKK